MYKISVSKHFDAAHFLREYEGKCARMHGHRWTVEVNLMGKFLDGLGMLVDFGKVKSILNHIIDEQFDHYTINDFYPFVTTNPTAENIAMYFYVMLKPQLPELLDSVRVYESPDCFAEYYGHFKYEQKEVDKDVS